MGNLLQQFGKAREHAFVLKIGSESEKTPNNLIPKISSEKI